MEDLRNCDFSYTASRSNTTEDRAIFYELC